MLWQHGDPRSQEVGEQIAARVGVAGVLGERFAVGSLNQPAALGTPLATTVEILVDPVLFEQPVALAGVAGQHFQLEVEDRGGLDHKLRRNGPMEVIDSFERIDVIEVRDLRQRWGGVPGSGGVVGDGCAEAGVANQLTGGFVIAHVVDRGGGEDEVGAGPPEDLGDPPAAGTVMVDLQILEFEAEVVGLQAGGGLGRLGPSNRGDLQRVEFCAPAVSRGHRGDGEVTAQLPQQCQRSRTLELDVVGVGMNRQDAKLGGIEGQFSGHKSGCFPKETTGMVGVRGVAAPVSPEDSPWVFRGAPYLKPSTPA